MEEVDNIIIHSLREIGCDIEERVTNLSGFDTDLVVDAAVRCLDIIRPGLGISRILPANMAARFRVGAALAQACSDLGYRGDIGYQTFLYSSETDLRRVFMFLIEKLPKESDKTSSEPSSKIDELEKSVAAVLSRDLSTPWLPHYCHKSNSARGGYVNVPYRTVNIEVPSVDDDKEFQNYYIRYQQTVPEQTRDRQYLLPSVLSSNAKMLHSRSTNIIERLDWLHSQTSNERSEEAVIAGTSSEIRVMSRFSLNERLRVSKIEEDAASSSVEKKSLSESEQASEQLTEQSSKQASVSREERQTAEIERMKSDCEKLRNDIDNVQTEMKKLAVQLSRVTASQQSEEKELEIREAERIIKSRTYDLLEDSETNIAKLKSVIEAGRNKLTNLANQWEKHRAPLIKQYRDGREKYSAKTNTSQKKLEELRLLRDKERELLEECHTKDQQYSQLLAEVQKLPKDVNRSAYTQRILEIINNVRKQKDEINKVLADTREIQKDINTLTGRLERSFTVVDELIFRDAKSNEASRRAYKLLATLHSDCSELVTMVEETGATLREIRDLEEQIDSESTKNVGANLERITADLKQMRQETASLTAQIENKKS